MQSITNKMGKCRISRHAIGCVVICHPTEGERYYLRLFLMNVIDSKSYKDLVIVNDIS